MNAPRQQSDSILLARIDERVNTLIGQAEKHDTRLGKVEQKVWMIGGALAVLQILVYLTPAVIRFLK